MIFSYYPYESVFFTPSCNYECVYRSYNLNKVVPFLLSLVYSSVFICVFLSLKFLQPQNYRKAFVILDVDDDDEELQSRLDRLLRTQEALSEEARFVLRHLFSHFNVWAAQEFAARMARKALATSDRSTALSGFKRELIFRLHRRFSDSNVTKLEHGKVDFRDRALLLRVKELFPFIDPIQVC